MMRIGGHTPANNLGINLSPARDRVIGGFQDERPGALADDKSIPVAVERP